MAQPYIEATDGYARAVSRVSNLLGHNQPADTQDRVIRDLLADVFDFLYEARDLIVGGKLAVAYPLARRAYDVTFSPPPLRGGRDLGPEVGRREEDR